MSETSTPADDFQDCEAIYAGRRAGERQKTRLMSPFVHANGLPLSVPNRRIVWEELDTCLSVIPGFFLAASAHLISPEQRDLCHGMNVDFLGVMTLANSKYAEWQASYPKA